MKTQYTHTRSWLGNYNIGYELNNNLTCLNIMMIYYYEDIYCFDNKHPGEQGTRCMKEGTIDFNEIKRLISRNKYFSIYMFKDCCNKNFILSSISQSYVSHA